MSCGIKCNRSVQRLTDDTAPDGIVWLYRWQKLYTCYVKCFFFFTLDAVSSRVNDCLRTSLCCRLGRKAVRLSYPVMYTCKIEALAQGLEYHTSVSHRLKLTPKVGQTDRMEAANSLHMSFGFRKRLMLCRAMGQVQKECFESCCERKLQEYQAKTRRITQTGKEQWDKKHWRKSWSFPAIRQEAAPARTMLHPVLTVFLYNL